MTLIEILVVLGLIATLSAMVMVIAPGALEKDRASAAVAQLEGALQISRARAMRDGLPRGIRILYNGSAQATSYQYIEVRPVFVPNPGGPFALPPYTNGVTSAVPPPYVQFVYTLSGNNIASRECRVYGLVADHLNELLANTGGALNTPGPVTSGAVLYLPTLGTWHLFDTVSGPFTDSSQPGNPSYYVLSHTPRPTPPVGQPPYPDWFGYPDAQLGTQTAWRTYHWGVYSLPQPLIGDPVLELPQKTCVDLNFSTAAAGTDLDILFGPSGQLVRRGAGNVPGHVFLWVRDPGRPAPTPGNPTAGTPGSGFEPAGEQLVVVIKAKSGAVGWAPADWGTDPFSLARLKVAGN
jgi:type II secretory pathway pseudopilin PulG